MKWTSLLVACGISLVACNNNESSTQEDLFADNVLAINPSQTFQEIEGFGASDAWAIQNIGTWSDPTRQAVADLLFSQELKEDGSPKGIGLNIWRFNIGTGSQAQGDNSNISDEWRRTEGFLQNDGSYDWTKQAGQRWFLQAAQQRGVSKFIGFSNSAPVQMTKNGKANTNVARQSNLAPKNFEKFANFLTDVALHLKEEEGIVLNELSPVNETQWDWDQQSGQEGCPFTNKEVTDLVRILDKKITEKGLSTKIELTEAGQIDYLYQSGTNRPGKDNQIEYFYGTGEDAVGDLKNISEFVAGHSYWTTEGSVIAPKRQELWAKLQEVNPKLRYNMSEYCIMRDSEEGISGNGRDLSIDMGLYLARVLHYDLTEANASAWQWWLAVSPYNYKDGLIYVDKDTKEAYETSKMLYAYGNFTRFIKKGMKRVHTNQLFGKTNEDAFTRQRITASAYANENELVVVLVNYNDYEYTIQLDIDDTFSGDSMKVYRTSRTENLAYVGEQQVEELDIKVAPKSVTTYVIEKN